MKGEVLWGGKKNLISSEGTRLVGKGELTLGFQDVEGGERNSVKGGHPLQQSAWGVQGGRETHYPVKGRIFPGTL